MKEPIRFIAICLSLMSLSTSNPGGMARAAEPQLPSPIQTEMVFPGLTFGEAGSVRLEAVVTVSNPGLREAAVFFDLYEPSGARAFLQFDQEEQRRPVSWRVSVPARSTSTLSFNRERRLVVPIFYQGWAMLRANQVLHATAALRVFDRESGDQTSELVVNGVPLRLTETRLPVVSGGTTQTGIALAIPSSPTSRRLTVQLLALPAFLDPPDSAVEIASESVLVPGNGQVSFLPSDLFPGQRGDYVRVSTEDPGGFAAAVIGTGIWQDTGLLYFFRPGAYNRSGDEQYFYEEGGDWEFSPGFQTPVMIADTRLTPTRFGVYLESPQDTIPRFFPFNTPEIFVDPDLEIAIAGDERAKIIVFGDGLVIEEPLPEHQLSINVLEDESIEIRAGFTFSVGLTAVAHKYVLIDPLSRSIIGRFTGPLGTTPPWR